MDSYAVQLKRIAVGDRETARRIILNYFRITGAIPLFVEAGEGWRIREGYSDDDIVVISLTDILASAEFDPISREITLSLLKKLVKLPTKVVFV